MIDSDFLNGLEKFGLIIRKKVTSNYKGARKSNAIGRGMLFKDHRQYARGDDFRSIDWRVFARTDDLMIKNYEEERSLTVHILVDGSKSMDYGRKFDYASMIGVGFAYLAMKSNDKFQFTTFSDDLSIYRAKRGKSQLMAMVDYLNDLKLSGSTKLSEITDKYRMTIGSRSLIIVISDFFVDISEIKKALFNLGRNEVIFIQVIDQKEKELKMEGDFKLVDSESNIENRTFISPKLRQNYFDRLGKHIAAIKDECTLNGVQFHSISTDTDIYEIFYQIMNS